METKASKRATKEFSLHRKVADQESFEKARIPLAYALDCAKKGYPISNANQEAVIARKLGLVTPIGILDLKHETMRIKLTNLGLSFTRHERLAERERRINLHYLYGFLLALMITIYGWLIALGIIPMPQTLQPDIGGFAVGFLELVGLFGCYVGTSTVVALAVCYCIFRPAFLCGIYKDIPAGDILRFARKTLNPDEYKCTKSYLRKVYNRQNKIDGLC